jgi:hypothetical protein
MSGNPYAAPATATPAPEAAARRHAAARRLGRRALMLMAGGLLVGGLCVIPSSLEMEDATRVRYWPLLLSLLAVALIAHLTFLTGIVLGLLAVVRGALRRSPLPPADHADRPSAPA